VIPGWKIKRELVRLGQQLRSIPEATWEPIAHGRHDAAFPSFPRHNGSQIRASRIALLLIWQPDKLAPSFLETCSYVAAHGYSLLVVANGGLSESARAALLPKVWLILERPNIGYDFGGYRDGLRILREDGALPDHLLILNDSIWYPVLPDEELISDALDSPADITGTILRHGKKEAFLESYFYAIKGHVLKHPGFWRFWDSYLLTGNKYKVIRRGERSFSAAMQAEGFTLAPLFAPLQFMEQIAAAPDALLRDVLRLSAFVDTRQADYAQLLARTGSRSEIHEFILRSLDRSQFYSTYPVASARLLGYPVLKKSLEPVSALWRSAWVAALNEGLIPSAQTVICDEIRACADMMLLPDSVDQ